MGRNMARVLQKYSAEGQEEMLRRSERNWSIPETESENTEKNNDRMARVLDNRYPSQKDG
jgi:hypothetical protein